MIKHKLLSRYFSCFISFTILAIFCFNIFNTVCFANTSNSPLFPLMSNLKHSSEYFVGREEFLKDMHDFFFNKDNSDKAKNDSLVISGSAGAGKTQVITRYAELHKTNYDIIWWFDLNKDMNEQYRNFARKWNKTIIKFHKDTAEQSFLQINLEAIDAVIIKEEVHDRLKTTRLNWLIILDNVKESALTLNDMPKKHNHLGYGHIILSTQNSTHYANVMHLDKLSREESVELLLKVTGENDTHNANILADTLNGYPLAISSAGSFMAYHTSINMEEYNRLFLNNRQELWDAEHKLKVKRDEFDSYQKTVFGALSLIIDNMKKESKLAHELLAIAAFLDNDKIPENILLQYFRNEYGQDSSDIEFNNALSILTKYSLLNRNYPNKRLKIESNKELLFTTHELIQIVTQDLLSEKEKQLYLNRAIIATNGLLPNNIYSLTDFLSQSSYYIPHITALIKNAEDMKLYNNEMMLLELRDLEYNLTVIRNDQAAEKMLQKIDEASKKTSDQDDFLKMRLAVMRSAYLAWVKADYPASLRQALLAHDLMEKLPSVSPEDKLMIYTRLARMYNMMGDNIAALKYANLGEQIVENIPNSSGYRQDFFITLARIELDTGNYPEALKYYNLSLTSNTKSQEEVLPSNLSIFLIHADILINMRRYKEAMHKLNALKKVTDKLPEGHFYKASIMSYHSYVGARLGVDLNQAIKTSLASQAMLKKFFGEVGYYKNRHAYMSHKFLGKIYEKQGDFVKAEQEYSTAFKILTNVYSQSNCATTDKLSNIYKKLAIINVKLQNLDEAFKYKKAHRKIFGMNHRRSIKLMKYFADNNVDVGY